MIYEIAALISGASLLALAVLTIWARKESWVRGGAVLLTILCLPLPAVVAWFALSHPAPFIAGLVDGNKTVLGVKMVQDEAIYVLLDFGVEHPRYFALPWDNETANKLQDLLDQQQRGEIPGFKMELPYEKSWNTRPKFFALPQPQVPMPKQQQQEAPRRLERSA